MERAPDRLALLEGHPALAGGPARVAAIGARELGPAARALARDLGGALARAGHVLRSGGSPGADQAFAAGAAAADGRVELVLPWPGFERAAWPPGALVEALDPERHRDWIALAAACRPDLAAVLEGAAPPAGDPRLRLARNPGILLGAGPVALCLAISPGPPAGGTAHALCCAGRASIPVLLIDAPREGAP